MAVYIKVQKMWQKNGKKWANQMYIIGLLIFNGTQTRAGLLQETAKKSSWPVTGLGNRGSLEVLNDIELILND